MGFDLWQAAIGAGLGGSAAAIFVLLLWWMVQRLPAARRPGLWLASGAVLRVGLVIGALLLFHDGHWERLAAALVGFVAVRSVLVRLAAWEQPASGSGPAGS